MLGEQEYSELHERLLVERQRLEDQIAGLQSGGVRADVFSADEMTDVVGQHPADAADELFEREKNLTLQRTLQVSLQQVNDALAKFDAGTYGTCERCGEPIAEKRLQALPEATYCIECQAIVEKGRAAGRA